MWNKQHERCEEQGLEHRALAAAAEALLLLQADCGPLLLPLPPHAAGCCITPEQPTNLRVAALRAAAAAAGPDRLAVGRVLTLALTLALDLP